MPSVTGATFYVEQLEKGFVERVYNWLRYLEIESPFPKYKVKGVLEVGNILRDIGDGKIYGMREGRAGKAVIRPGDFVSLLYVLFGDQSIRGTILESEPGALAATVLATGDYKRAVDDFLRSKYKDEEKRVARVVTEATLVGGNQSLEWLKEISDGVFEQRLSLRRLKNTIIAENPWTGLAQGNYVTLIHHLNKRITEFEIECKKSFNSAEDYLVSVHKIPKRVAEKIVRTTNHTTDTVIRAIDDTKKNMIGAFKGLASFLHINLNYPLDEAIARTTKMFENDEAMTISQTLYHGSKEVFARFEEYGVPRKLTVALVDKLISNGSDYARLYAERFPELLDFSQRFGPNGLNLLERVLRDRGLTYMLLNQNGVRVLNDVYKKDPSSFPALLDNLLQIDWGFKKRFADIHALSDPTSDFQKLPGKLDSETRAKILALAIAGDSMKEDQRAKLLEHDIQLPQTVNIENFLDRMYYKYQTSEKGLSLLEEQVQKYFDKVKDTRKLLTQRKVKALPK